MSAAKAKKVAPALPHYTEKSVLALFKSGDPRIQDNIHGTYKCIVLSDVPGYFTYSDKRGGIATFYNGDTEQPVFTVSREITPKRRPFILRP